MKKLNMIQICLLALFAVLNIAGGNIALLLRLPIYLDSLGTMLAAALFGPFYGMIPGIISGTLSGCINDPYAFYYIPVQMIIGFIAGFLFLHINLQQKKPWIFFLLSACLSIPGTFVSSAVTAILFGGITSSGSTVLVQILHGTGLPLTLSVCIVQAVTDYLDRTIVLFATVLALRTIPLSLRAQIQTRHVQAKDKKGDQDGTL